MHLTERGEWKAKHEDMVDRFEELCKRIWEKEQENAELLKERNYKCAYCSWGDDLEGDVTTISDVKRHISVCEFHPMRKLEQENAELKRDLDEAHVDCRMMQARVQRLIDGSRKLQEKNTELWKRIEELEGK